jgi:hypothetical protein
MNFENGGLQVERKEERASQAQSPEKNSRNHMYDLIRLRLSPQPSKRRSRKG